MGLTDALSLMTQNPSRSPLSNRGGAFAAGSLQCAEGEAEREGERENETK